ncbi:hypothetical protein SUGI_0183880 [Cryptomeria japonica]|uniref:uncharacterized protein LOC131051847 n=1 Tax=Cryptomeria japonica TaxID=3369 RepID=UPI002408E7B6|nr:uncharacterized protein LOC131051847 [Cryptomeria japonica]GLJ12085.1 hypothetical protein SUGI_0183880 [Cryptomeria japonica]
MASSMLKIISVMLVILWAQGECFAQGPSYQELMDVNVEGELFEPAEKQVQMMMLVNETERRRNLGSFQLCSVCTCCGGSKKKCVSSPCCYKIVCNIPNKPFGLCSFTPKACNCLGCHL